MDLNSIKLHHWQWICRDLYHHMWSAWVFLYFSSRQHLSSSQTFMNISSQPTAREGSVTIFILQMGKLSHTASRSHKISAAGPWKETRFSESQGSAWSTRPFFPCAPHAVHTQFQQMQMGVIHTDRGEISSQSDQDSRGVAVLFQGSLPSYRIFRETHLYVNFCIFSLQNKFFSEVALVLLESLCFKQKTGL